MHWLAQVGQVDDTGVILLVVTVAAIAAVVVAVRERGRSKALEERLGQLRNAMTAHAEQAQSAEQTDRERQSLMFEQHKKLNELTMAKFEAEIQLIRNQTGERDREQERYEAGKEYHELMVEKTRLEIDSLRLHIAELRQRLDDWKFGG